MFQKVNRKLAALVTGAVLVFGAGGATAYAAASSSGPVTAQGQGGGPVVAQGQYLNVCISQTNESQAYYEEHSSELGNCRAGYTQFTIPVDPARYPIQPENSQAPADVVTVAQPGPQTTVAGSAVSLGMVASSNEGHQITGWSVNGLPAGLSLSSSGTILGTPTVVGTTLVTVTAIDNQGTAGFVQFTWTVS